MTTIVYDGKNLAADRRVCVGDTPLRIPHRKILPITHGGRHFLMAGTGTRSHIGARVVHHLTEPWVFGEPPRWSSGAALECTVLLIELIVDKGSWKHCAWLLTKDGGASDITGRLWALGSGADYALGALGAGANPPTAVAIAAEHDVWTGDGVQDELIANWLQRAANLSDEFAPLHPRISSAGHGQGSSLSLTGDHTPTTKAEAA